MQSVGQWPAQLQDSKLISAKIREALVNPVKQWVVADGIGYASAADIDEIGITQCLAMAAHRAFAELPTALHAEMQQSHSVAILDGSHNWLGKLGEIEITLLRGPLLS
jgi:ribonuclease HII